MLQPVLLNVALGSYRKLAGFLLLPLLSPGLSSFGFLLFLLDGQASKRSVFLFPVSCPLFSQAVPLLSAGVGGFLC